MLYCRANEPLRTPVGLQFILFKHFWIQSATNVQKILIFHKNWINISTWNFYFWEVRNSNTFIAKAELHWSEIKICLLRTNNLMFSEDESQVVFLDYQVSISSTFYKQFCSRKFTLILQVRPCIPNFKPNIQVGFWVGTSFLQFSKFKLNVIFL